MGDKKGGGKYCLFLLILNVIKFIIVPVINQHSVLKTLLNKKMQSNTSFVSINTYFRILSSVSLDEHSTMNEFCGYFS